MASPETSVLSNVSFWSAAAGWFAAQAIKMVTHGVRHQRIDFRFFVSTGGMPSAHSALVAALATSVGIRTGWNSATFAVAACFAVIVMFDAQSVRRAAGQQARVLNQIVDELFQHHHLSANKLAELLGHTRLEVFFGMLLGIATAFAVHAAS